jgi:hypothetical protein
MPYSQATEGGGKKMKPLVHLLVTVFVETLGNPLDKPNVSVQRSPVVLQELTMFTLVDGMGIVLKLWLSAWRRI